MRRILLLAPLVLVMGTVALAQSPSWLGLGISDGLENGVVVDDVQDESPAGEAGVEVGDLIVEFDGIRVAGVRQLTRIVRETPVGRTVSVELERDGQERTLELTTQARRSARFLDDFFSEDFPNLSVEIDRGRDVISGYHAIINPASLMGVRVETMTDQLKEFFGVNPEVGMLVVSVEPGSRADDAGIHAGDVIVGLNGRLVDSSADLNPGRIRNREEVRVTIVRDRSEIDITVDLDE